MKVTLKLATSLDGRIATSTGESRWITGPLARQRVHHLRAEHQAVAVGSETALSDDPDLGVRLPEFTGPQPARVVFDRRQRLPLQSKLANLARAGAEVWVISPTPLGDDLKNCGLKGLKDPALTLPEQLSALAKNGITSIFFEGGGQMAAALIEHGVVDRLEWFRAPILLGAEGRPALGALSFGALDQAPRFFRTKVEALGPDLWETYERL